MWPPLNVVHLHICSSLETHFSSAFILSEEVRKRTESAPPPPEQNHAPSLLLDVSIARPCRGRVLSFTFYHSAFSDQLSWCWLRSSLRCPTLAMLCLVSRAQPVRWPPVLTPATVSVGWAAAGWPAASSPPTPGPPSSTGCSRYPGTSGYMYGR